MSEEPCAGSRQAWGRALTERGDRVDMPRRASVPPLFDRVFVFISVPCFVGADAGHVRTPILLRDVGVVAAVHIVSALQYYAHEATQKSDRGGVSLGMPDMPMCWCRR